MATIRDVARVAGVSVATVSRVLSASGPVSEETRNKVLQACATINYQPNSIARALVTGKSALIGLVLPDITNPFFPHVARGIEDAARNAEYTVLLGNSDDNPEQELTYVRTFVAQRVDGLILITSSVDPDPLLRAIGTTPFVFIDRMFSGFESKSVVTDNQFGARLVVDHLLSLGHRSILYLGGPAGISSSQERLAGVRAATRGTRTGAKATQDADSIQVLETVGSYTFESGYQRTILALDAGRKFTAVAAGNDILALGALKALHDRGFVVPEDVSVTGYDDVTLARLVSPPLTTVTQPAYLAGMLAVERLLNQLHGGDSEVQDKQPVVLKPRLVIRGSTAPANHSRGLSLQQEM